VSVIPAPSPARLPEGAIETRQVRRLVLICLTAAFTYIFLANAWLGDDAYITFRVVWNLLHGYGAVFNPGERVQAYTHPLWFLVMTVAHAVTRDFYFTCLVVSYGFTLAAILTVVKSARDIAAGAVAFLWLVSSKAFVDYTSSGLEYPLSYLLLALFYVRFFTVGDGSLTEKDLRRFGLLAGLAFVNRIDSVVLYAVPLAWLAFRCVRRREGRLAPLVVAFAVPAGAWVLFATVYYGFPLPNTYYAKVATGIPSALLYRQGFAYLINSFGADPVTLGTVAIASVLALRSTLAVRTAMASSLLYVAYTISVGGDFMSGRFFAMPFLVAVMATLHVLKNVEFQRVTGVALLAYNLFMPIVPVKTTASYDAAWPWRSQNGIKDERGHYHQITNVFRYSPFHQLPDHTWVREGLSFRNGPGKVTVQGSIGFFGLAAGPEKHLVDRNALSDPLLARLPVSPRLYFEFYAGHYFRDIPEGYLETLESGTNRLTDPALHEYYERLNDALRGPLFSTRRLRSLWYLNAGAGRRFAARYDRKRPISLSVRAANERFITDAGDRDVTAGVIRSVGRAGYLQYGPGIPMKVGTYRARWVGVMNGSLPPGAIGFVDVWAGDRRLARREILAGEMAPEAHLLAQIDFVLLEPTGNLDYRIWIDGRTSTVLERVELASAGVPEGE
jgi:arabinofuranosyltransferase